MIKRLLFFVGLFLLISFKEEVEVPPSSEMIDYGTYSIANSADARVMQIQGDLLFNEKYWKEVPINLSAPEAVNEENLERWQEWDIIHNSTADGVKYYQIRNLHSGMFLNAASADAQVKQNWELKSTMDPQLWKIE